MLREDTQEEIMENLISDEDLFELGVCTRMFVDKTVLNTLLQSINTAIISPIIAQVEQPKIYGGPLSGSFDFPCDSQFLWDNKRVVTTTGSTTLSNVTLTAQYGEVKIPLTNCTVTFKDA